MPCNWISGCPIPPLHWGGDFLRRLCTVRDPANLILNKIGAQKWLSITTVIWGVLSAMTGFVTNETQFIVLRFLLGLGEAGFIREFYYWLPSISRIKSGLGDWYFVLGVRWR